MTALTRRTLLGAASAASLATVLTACSDTGADGTAIASATDGADYGTVINSGPVASAEAVAASTWATAIKEAGKLTTGGTKTSLVFSQEDPTTGQLKGFDAAIAQALARYIIGGQDAASLVEVTQATSDTRETLLENGQVQAVLATYTITPERAQKISFAGPYYSSGQAILVASDNKDIKGLDDLAGIKVAVQSSSSSGPALAEHAPQAEVVQFEDDGKCLAALAAGQVKAYVVDYALLLSHVATDDQYRIVGEPFTEDPYGIGLPKDSDAQAFVNTFLQAIYDDGTWAAIWAATIGAIVGGQAPEPPRIGSVPGSQAGGSAAPSADAGEQATDAASAQATEADPPSPEPAQDPAGDPGHDSGTQASPGVSPQPTE
ncbi:transporter substrate-binding domain-containing protein [Actinomyces bowdenii]|uniref:glutamate ABC transporter substrate-binding protein n=1 Tax=Actinomyces bowdenii TaxID=131109 RepID=UPI001ABBF62F|nr:glutamate ABC transporter substrate-binding protein [Actinomyces bowdenii]MBO3724346.1 transporter substrate-binding domain-containing protein [Actinomyces bowdenii]